MKILVTGATGFLGGALVPLLVEAVHEVRAIARGEAQKAVALGLKVPPHVKTSMAPGSKVVSEYLSEAGLVAPLEALGFHTVGYGCTTCIAAGTPVLLGDGTVAGSGRTGHERAEAGGSGELRLVAVLLRVVGLRISGLEQQAIAQGRGPLRLRDVLGRRLLSEAGFGCHGRRQPRHRDRSPAKRRGHESGALRRDRGRRRK